MQIKSGIIVSIQPRKTSRFNNPQFICDLAEDVRNVAVALRIEGAPNIAAVKETVKNIPVIGLKKIPKNNINLITPSIDDAMEVVDAGADFVACELSPRTDYLHIETLVDNGIPVIADIATIEDAKTADDYGVEFITTAIAGYVNKISHCFLKPDIGLVEECVKKCNTPIIAEGRYWIPKQLHLAHEAGAHAVCIGTAIVDAFYITQHAAICFDGSWEELNKKEYEGLPKP